LAWLLAQKPWIVPIPGTTKSHRLLENLGGAALALNGADLARIADVLARIPVEGARYPAALAARAGR
ncbi:MAG: aldo/keto reductase, partial [Candidatus Competibacter denitrificans]